MDNENSVYSYVPNPIDTNSVELLPDILALIELLAEHTHDIWALQRIKDGWLFGPERSDTSRTHPCLIPYQLLSETEKEYDRLAAVGVIKAIVALGYRIEGSASQIRE